MSKSGILSSLRETTGLSPNEALAVAARLNPSVLFDDLTDFDSRFVKGQRSGIASSSQPAVAANLSVIAARVPVAAAKRVRFAVLDVMLKSIAGGVVQVRHSRADTFGGTMSADLQFGSLDHQWGELIPVEDVAFSFDGGAFGAGAPGTIKTGTISIPGAAGEQQYVTLPSILLTPGVIVWFVPFAINTAIAAIMSVRLVPTEPAV